MAQTYQMKHNVQGTIYSLLTVESDGRMTMTFHGTDREICHDVTENADGWLCYPGGSLFPGLESGKWQAVDDVRGLTADVVETNTNNTNNTNEVAESETTTDGTDNHAEPEVIEETTDNTDCADNEVCVPATVEPIMADSPQLETSGYSSSAELEQLRAENQRLQEQIAQMANQPRPRRQRKPRKPRVERQSSAIRHQPSDIDRHQTSDIDRHPSSTLKAIGMVAAATVALLVIYETGLLIPLGLIGLATGGILK